MFVFSYGCFAEPALFSSVFNVVSCLFFFLIAVPKDSSTDRFKWNSPIRCCKVTKHRYYSDLFCGRYTPGYGVPTSCSPRCIMDENNLRMRRTRYILAEKWTHWRQDLWREVTETVHDGGKKVKQHTVARNNGKM